MFLPLLFALSAQADHPAGSLVKEALVLQVSDGGLDALAELVPAFIPAEGIAVPDQDQDNIFFSFSLTGMMVDVTVDSAEIQSNGNGLVVVATLAVTINDAANPFVLDYDTLIADDVCPGYVKEFHVDIEAPVELFVAPGADGKPQLFATVGDIAADSDLGGFDTVFDCNTDILETVLGILGLYDFLIGTVVTPLIQDELQTALDDALVSVRFEDQIALGETTLDVALYPQKVQTSTQGLEIFLQTAFSAPQNPCVAQWDGGSSVSVDSDPPGIGAVPAGAAAYVLVSDDMLNQALYAVWRGGLLCYTVDAASSPIPLDSGLLNVISGDAFVGILPETAAPLVILTQPKSAPTVDPSGPHDVDIAIDSLDLEFYTGIDGREARVLLMELDANIGADVNFDATTGSMSVVLDMEDAFQATVGDDLFVPGSAQAIEESFGPTLEGLVQPLIGSLVGDQLAFALPAFGAVGLTSIEVGDAGAQGDWLGAQASLGPVTYGAEGGCGEGGGCESGCSTSGRFSPGLVLLAALALVRRRR